MAFLSVPKYVGFFPPADENYGVSFLFAGLGARLWCVNELKNGLQQGSVIPAEAN